MVKVKRNAPCHCGSGKKYKKCCTLKVTLINGRVAERFAQKNPEISRTIQILGRHTLEELHDIIFRGFDRYESEHMYEFQFGENFNAPENDRYVLPETLSHQTIFKKKAVAGLLTKTRIGALNLTVGQNFYYWFDFGDDWIHEIEVISIDDEIWQDIYPKIIARIGESPPQYIEWDEEEE